MQATNRLQILETLGSTVDYSGGVSRRGRGGGGEVDIVACKTHTKQKRHRDPRRKYHEPRSKTLFAQYQ